MAYSRTNALGTYILQVTDTGRWNMSILGGKHSYSAAYWMNRLLQRDAFSIAMTPRQYRELNNVLAFKPRNRSPPMDASATMRVVSEAFLQSSNASCDDDNDESTDALTARSLDEFVVYTSILNKSPGKDTIVILSTERVVVVSYKRNSTTSRIKTIWQCSLKNSSSPRIDLSGAVSILTLRAKADARQQQTNNFSHLEFEIKRGYNDHDLVNIYNVLNALLKNFDYFIPVASQDSFLRGDQDVFFDAEQSIFRIGPWEYAKVGDNDVNMYIDYSN